MEGFCFSVWTFHWTMLFPNRAFTSSINISTYLYLASEDTEKKTKSNFCHEVGFIIFWILTIWIWFEFSMASYCVYPFVDLVYFQITTHIYSNLVAVCAVLCWFKVKLYHNKIPKNVIRFLSIKAFSKLHHNMYTKS